MTPQEVAALLAYMGRLDPRSVRTDRAEARDQLAQWAELLATVPATTPNGWDAAEVIRRHVTTSPYPLLPVDLTRAWNAHARDVLGRHVDPTPAADPDDPVSWRAELLGTRHAVAAGTRPPNEQRELTGAMHEDVAARLAELGRYIPPAVEDVLDQFRPGKAARRAAIKAGRPDALAVPCTYCKAEANAQCTRGAVGPDRRRGPRAERRTPHPCRVEAAAARVAEGVAA
ncbi:hypothetical protein ACIQVR_29105 [Streptomyces xanthochromogenes]|uniref:zinc finger domain-containing protein n=1 Tax=Streptomyces xanthochromogenes TaxID=67384 RepID=UPI00380B5057